MERFFIMIDGQQQGPLTKQDMINQGISNDTYVYNKALGTWKMISEIPGFLSDIIDEQPPVFIPEPIISQGPRTIIPTIPPKTYLTESILVTLFCCLPFGIASIVNASKVASRFASGDYEGADEASKNAKKWMYWAIGFGIAWLIYYFSIIMPQVAKYGF